MKNITKAKTLSLTPGGIQLRLGYGECGSIDAKDRRVGGQVHNQCFTIRQIKRSFRHNLKLAIPFITTFKLLNLAFRTYET